MLSRAIAYYSVIDLSNLSRRPECAPQFIGSWSEEHARAHCAIKKHFPRRFS